MDAKHVDEASISVPAKERIASLVARHHRLVWRSLRRLGVPEGDADDATQRVFLVAHRRLADIAPESERPFLLQTALRVAAEFRRGRDRRREEHGDHLSELADPMASPEELLDRRRARALLDRALETMPIGLRTVLVLFEIEQLTMAEISGVLEIPPGTVASRLRSAREVFRQNVSQLSTRSVRYAAGGKP